MRVIVFGATGRTGRHVLRLALDKGHEVTAFGRSADRLDPEPGVSAFKGDVLDPGAVAAAVEGHDGAMTLRPGSSRSWSRTSPEPTTLLAPCGIWRALHPDTPLVNLDLQRVQLGLNARGA